MIPFVADAFLCTPFDALGGAPDKNARILAAAAHAPERFGVPPGPDAAAAIAARLTDPRNAAWEVWQNDTLCGILLLDRIEAPIGARLHFVFFDNDLAGKTTLLRAWIARYFEESALERLTLEVPDHMQALIGFARKKLGFLPEGRIERGAFDGAAWHDVSTLRVLRREVVLG